MLRSQNNVATSMMDDGPSLSSTNTARKQRTTKVLIARTVSPSEYEHVVADVHRINSHHQEASSSAAASSPSSLASTYLAESMSQCNLLHNSSSTITPYSNGSKTFPNHVLCDPNNYNRNNQTIMGMEEENENNYLTVKADFLLLARNAEVANSMSNLLASTNSSSTSHEQCCDNVEIVDVSLGENTIKIWNWIQHLNEIRLYDYDYVWMIDGDIDLSSLNWHAFWQQVKLIRPKICQPAVIGNDKGAHGTSHSILNYYGDSRVLASEVAIIELMTPLFEVDTWLGYRDVIANQSQDLLNNLKKGGEDCFDLAWCHYAKFNMVGEQIWPPKKLGYRPSAPTYATLDYDATVGDNVGSNGGDNGDNGDNNNSSTTVAKKKPFEGHNSCVVLYQTPVVHMNKKSLGKGRNFRKGGTAVCKYFRENYRIHWAIKSVYEVFVAPA